MSSPEHAVESPPVSLQMQRLLNPGYWGGLVLGVEPGFEPSVPKADEASAKFAVRALESVLAIGARDEPLQTYAPDSTFTPDEHQPGTVVIYRQETLFRRESHIPFPDMEKFHRRAAPKGPTDLEREMSNKTLIAFRPRHLIDGGAVHREEVRYGVIPPNYGRKQSVLITISGFSVNQSIHRRRASDLKRGKVGSVGVDSDWPYPRVERQPIPIGTARHFKRARPKKADNPRLVKVNCLEILKFGRSA